MDITGYIQPSQALAKKRVVYRAFIPVLLSAGLHLSVYMLAQQPGSHSRNINMGHFVVHPVFCTSFEVLAFFFIAGMVRRSIPLVAREVELVYSRHSRSLLVGVQ